MEVTVAKRDVAVVTGGSRGIGRATCLALARDGFAVVVNYCNNKAAALDVIRLIEGFGGMAMPVQADVGKPEDVKKLFEAVDKWSDAGDLKVLVNNAAILGPKKASLDEVSVELINDMFRTNVTGVILCTQAAVSRMSNRGGSIVNVSSGSAYMGRPLVYGMSKSALNAFQAGIVAELSAKNIRINSVSPGVTDTDMVDDDIISRAMSSIPMHRAGQPEEIAEGILWLASEKSSYTTGANIRIAGGRPCGHHF